MRSLAAHEIKSILVVELTRLGDVVTMLPSIRLLADHFAGSRITLLVDQQYESFLRSLGLPCEVQGIRSPESVTGFLRAVTYVRKLDVDLALSMSPPKRNAAVTLTSGATRKVGYLTFVHSLTPYLESTPVEAFGCEVLSPEKFEMENIEERSLKVCKAVGISENAMSPLLHVDENLFREQRRRLLSKGQFPDRSFVVLHPFSGWEFRSWNLMRFNEVCEAVLGLNYEVVFLCEKQEEERLAESRRQFAGRKGVLFFASDNLLETAALLKEAALVVCNDSGPLHLAAALGVRVVGLFGPASPELTAPRSVVGSLLYEKVECSPCDQCKCIRPDNSCMSLVSPSDVIRCVMKELPLLSEEKAVANA